MLDKKRKIKKILSVVNLIAFIIFLLLTLIIGGAAISSSAVNDDLNLFGYNFILTKDLTENNTTTFAITKKFELKDINQNEIILYKLKNNDVSMFAKLKSKTSNRMVVENLVTKKDITIEVENLENLSCIRLTSKTLGDFIQFIQTPRGLIILISCVAVILILVLLSTILIHIKFEKALKQIDLNDNMNQTDENLNLETNKLEVKTNLENSEDITDTYITVDKNLPKINHIIEFEE